MFTRVIFLFFHRRNFFNHLIPDPLPYGTPQPISCTPSSQVVIKTLNKKSGCYTWESGREKELNLELEPEEVGNCLSVELLPLACEEGQMRLKV
jgi:hypothetical protein